MLAAPARIDFSVARGATGTEIRALSLVAAGLAAEVTGWLRSAGSDLSAELDFRDIGQMGGGFRGALRGQAKLTGTPETGAFSLDAQAEGLAVGQPEADRLLRGTSTLSVAVRTEGGALRVDKVALTNPQVSLNATGRAAGNGRQVDIAGKLADLGLLLPEFPGPLTVSGTAEGETGAMRLDVTARGPGRIEARVAGRVAPTRSDLAITGTAQAALANPFISPRTISGPLRFDLRLEGPPALRSLSGRVALSDGGWRLPSCMSRFRGSPPRPCCRRGRATVTADAASAAGGRIGRGAASGWRGLRRRPDGGARGMVLRDPELYETQVNGEVRVVGPLAGGARISGTLTLPETEIRVPSTLAVGSGAIPDLRHRNEPAAVGSRAKRAACSGTRRRTGARGPRGPSRWIWW